VLHPRSPGVAGLVLMLVALSVVALITGFAGASALIYLLNARKIARGIAVV
jgi:hypothetical protein